jgi:hypothetical protein
MILYFMTRSSKEISLPDTRLNDKARWRYEMEYWDEFQKNINQCIMWQSFHAEHTTNSKQAIIDQTGTRW